MTKKEKNKKAVLQTKRNYLINSKYITIFKSLIKTIRINRNNTTDKISIEKLKVLLNNLYSSLDKAVKKNILHKNNAAKKKSKITKLLNYTITI